MASGWPPPASTIGGDLIGVNASGHTNNPAGRLTTPLPPTPTTPAFARPPQGNVIASNGSDGVRITKGANANTLEGNYIGTDVSGTQAARQPRRRRGDPGANGNQILGTTAPDKNDPFVFYNVISGNRGNGLVLDGATNTTVFADFFWPGLGQHDPSGQPAGRRAHQGEIRHDHLRREHSPWKRGLRQWPPWH